MLHTRDTPRIFSIWRVGTHASAIASLFHLGLVLHNSLLDNADRNLTNLDEKSKFHRIGMLVVTKLNKFHGIGMLEVTKSNKFCGIGMLDVTTFYLFIYFI